MNRTNRSIHAETIRAHDWAMADRTIAEAKARCIAADMRAAELRANRKPQPQPRGFLRLFRSI